MQERWNQFVYELFEAKKNNVDEDIYHKQIEQQLQLLGWAKWNGEICHKPNVPIGNSKFIQPDILIKHCDEDLFVIEVKRPVHQQSERERVQLESYMRQLKIEVGVYIGEHIEVFYDRPKSKDAVSVMTIPLEINNKLGVRFVEKFSKEGFSKEAVVDFCEARIKEMQRQANLNKIRESLIADAQQQIFESLLSYLSEKYGDSFSETDIRGMLGTLRFTATFISDGQPAVTPIGTKLPTSPLSQPATIVKKRVYDHTEYSFDGGPFLRKNQFVHAVVAAYMQQHPETTFHELEQVFPSELQGSFGVVRTLDYIREKNYHGRRYFVEAENVLTSRDGIEFAVSTEWGKENLPALIGAARKAGFHVQASSEERPSQKSSTGDNVACRLMRNADARGMFSLADHSLTVLKGSKVNARHVDKFSEADRKKRDQQLADHTKLVDGERIVTKDIRFRTPSGAAKFCVGGSANGWTEWEDTSGKQLKEYRG